MWCLWTRVEHDICSLTNVTSHAYAVLLLVHVMWSQEHCRISPPCFLTECRKWQLNQGSLGVPRQQPHCRSGLLNLPSVGAVQGLNYSVIGSGALFCGHWNENTQHTHDDRGLVPCTIYKLWPITIYAAGEIAVNNDLNTKNSTKFLYYTAHAYSLKITWKVTNFLARDSL